MDRSRLYVLKSKHGVVELSNQKKTLIYSTVEVFFKLKYAETTIEISLI